jgi:hypothetical protein
MCQWRWTFGIILAAGRKKTLFSVPFSGIREAGRPPSCEYPSDSSKAAAAGASGLLTMTSMSCIGLNAGFRYTAAVRCAPFSTINDIFFSRNAPHSRESSDSASALRPAFS